MYKNLGAIPKYHGSKKLIDVGFTDLPETEDVGTFSFTSFQSNMSKFSM